MTDITDIFDDLPETKTKAKSEDALDPEVARVADSMLGAPQAPPGVPGKVHELAVETATAYDQVEMTNNTYQARRAELMAKVDAELAGEREAVDAARDLYSGLTVVLRAAMEKENLTEVPLRDRSPVLLKTTKGAKESCTKTFLKKTLGKKDADALWDKLPRKPDKVTLVVPSAPPPDNL